jgi:hypothetical protein
VQSGDRPAADRDSHQDAKVGFIEDLLAKGQHSIRINDQYRVCFRWESDYADEVEVTDNHQGRG